MNILISDIGTFSNGTVFKNQNTLINLAEKLQNKKVKVNYLTYAGNENVCGWNFNAIFYDDIVDGFKKIENIIKNINVVLLDFSWKDSIYSKINNIIIKNEKISIFGICEFPKKNKKIHNFMKNNKFDFIFISNYLENNFFCLTRENKSLTCNHKEIKRIIMNKGIIK